MSEIFVLTSERLIYGGTVSLIVVSSCFLEETTSGDNMFMVTMQLKMLFQDEAVQGCSRDVQDDALVTTNHRWQMDDTCDKNGQGDLLPLNCYARGSAGR